jgi:putative SbcD/Mre11-related phosphoesterase
MSLVEPVPGEAAAVADIGEERALVVADLHAGIEAWLRHEKGLRLDPAAERRRETVLGLVEQEQVDRVVFLGDLAHFFGGPHGAERGEIELLLEQLSVPATLVKGNHDGGIEEVVGDLATVTDPAGIRVGDVGFVHGHTWPAREVLAADTVCIGHEHPAVAMEDEVGGRRVEPVWLRGPLAREPFAERYDDLAWRDPELVVFPAFNDRVGGKWVNGEDADFLAPFLPRGLPAGQAYLLDGTRLGEYREM